ncbi:hypothetical protein [Candidatus Nitrosocosmicus arcticus]|uniref:Uncharacterized protein n=1 Tax=Candidatus Nitrosocosmicus arcticus TaxID=2035267 RepID=A0A557SZ02_9ARCH|nr:hypothetical protein [Candidatus Nitrosocosmicus arcticus]TVP41836.1 hypothetical protein NARC_10242 [Candidatus Nitrosocosmicus arcticus]
MTHPENAECNEVQENKDIINKKIISTKKSCFKPYFGTILSGLAMENEENANTI